MDEAEFGVNDISEEEYKRLKEKTMAKKKKKSYVKFLKRKRMKRNTKGILKILKEKKTSSEQSQNELEPIEDGIPYAILEDENK